MKYIVYKTTNKINNYIYIGVHKTKDPYVFDGYIGCGINIKIPYTYKYSKTKFQQAVNEYGVHNFFRETLAIFDTDEEAYSLERLIVNENFLARSDVYNMILGGINTKEKNIKIFMYSKDGKYINEFNSYEDAARELNVQSSSIRRAVIYKYRVKNNYFSTDKLDNIDINLYNTNLEVRTYRYLKTGEFDCEFKSYNEASKYTYCSASNIRSAVLDGHCINNEYYFSIIKEDTYDKARNIQIKNRKVYKYDSKGNYIESYESQKLAEKQNPYSNITKSIKYKSIDKNGFMWSLEKLKYFNAENKNKKRKVGLFDDDGNIIKIWESARQCSKEVGCSVQNVLNGKYEKHKGQIYKYIDN